MAERKIKISPRGAKRQQVDEKPQVPRREPEPEATNPTGSGTRVWPSLMMLALLTVVLLWIFNPFASSAGSDEEFEPEQKEERLDLSMYETRLELYASSGYDIYDVIELLKVPRNSIQAILDAYRGQQDKANLPENVYRVFTQRDNPRRDALLIIEPDPPLYQMIITLDDPVGARIFDKDVETRVHTTSVVLPYPSLGNALWDAQVPRDILVKIEEAFAWTVDLHHLQAGDRIEMIYEEYLADGKSLGTGRVYCFRFDTHDGTYYAFNYHDGSESVYLDENALSMKKRFLKAPVKYSRITSHYGARTHPIKQEVHVHKGTDFAAPRGTPILALADGIITARSFTSGNGNFVKIRHDQTYDTQYLHMDNFEETMQPGSHVKQGDVSGYVGSTGLATGPHVCLRFWKNGEQVNFIKEDAMDARPLRASAVNDFLAYRDSLMNVLNVN